MVPRAADRPSAPVPALPGGYQQHKSIDEYYKRLGPNAPIKTLVEEVADNQANAHEALKFGNDATSTRRWRTSRPAARTRPAYRAAMPIRRAAQHKAIDDMMNNETPDRSERRLHRDPRHGARAARRRVPADHDPDGLQRDPAARGERLDPRQRLPRAQPDRRRVRDRAGARSCASRPSELNPSMYRCAKTSRRRRSPSAAAATRTTRR